MSRPRIGLTLDADQAGDRYLLGRAYVDAVAEAGGLPLLLPHLAALAAETLAALDGLVISGGAFDVPPELYGEARRPACGPSRPERTRAELALLQAALAAGLPVLGVCGGMQLMAVARGGALWQDLVADLGPAGPDGAPPGRRVAGLRHEQPAPKDVPSHLVEVAPGTRLAGLVGAGPLMVNSTHHQAVRAPGAGVVVSALAPDGVVEALELAGPAFALGVQWHPEAAARHEPRHAAIYRGLVEAARRT
ncbi:MAG: gamma-glutamyl-gamma-aminobutyrate hydrolase family protein [Anaeromyxobacter sp.]|nr:gamma-glutamyl-gamma-aminobutyrate hydrolase family protein [Anaeromyxobacter sp.]MBL0278243.1 gamma-glutamyl-gamma-aminobutyrate hydrolase family protein [Anaeromyxobacter sp.]